jgi:hypothetical protein
MDPDSIFKVRQGNSCAGCNAEKEPGKLVCRRCYFRLPENLRKGLWLRPNRGLTQAANRAIEWLKKNPL